jgi:tRNA A37 threonylcarbamoyladenosine dehydratase
LASKIRHIVKDEKLKDFPVVYSTENATPQINGGREFGSVITVTGTFGLMLAEYVIKNLIK